MMAINVASKGPDINDDSSYHETLAQHERQPYIPPRVNVTHPSIQGASTTYLAESQNGGLWMS